MATKKRMSPDTAEARAKSQLKTVGKYYSGKGSGSADAQTGRAATRISNTRKAVSSEGPKRGQAPKKAASPAPKKATPAGRQAANTKGQSSAGRSTPKKSAGSKSSTVGNIAKGAAVAAGTAAAAYAAGRVGGRVAGAAAYRPATVYSASGAGVMRLDEVTPGSLQVSRTNRDAMGQSLGGWGRGGRGGVRQNPTRLWK